MEHPLYVIQKPKYQDELEHMLQPMHTSRPATCICWHERSYSVAMLFCGIIGHHAWLPLGSICQGFFTVHFKWHSILLPAYGIEDDSAYLSAPSLNTARCCASACYFHRFLQ